LYHVAIVFQEWLSRATNWAKFSATAGLGVIHRGHLQQGRALMAPYLPQSGAVGGGSPYSEGGALYALGLIHANHGEGIKQFLRESLRNSSAEVIIVYFLSFILLFISCILC
jgi:26S proteasome regulatory subunit N2